MISIYINGILDKQQETSNSLSTAFDSNNVSIGTHGSEVAHGKLNDFRIYDHALSPMEVKELSKGLVLHYPLSDIYVEATTNLITTEDCLSSTCYNGATSKYGYGTNTDMYKIVTTYDGRKGTKVYMGTNGNTAFPYVYINNMFTSDGTNSPTYKTLSFDYYTNIGTSIRPYRLGNGSGTATYRITNKNGIATGTGTDAISIPVITNGWNHIEITFHGTATADSQWGYIQNYPSHTSNTNNFWFFANMQLETKDHATGYAGVGGTRNSNIVYDCSGFCNNGVKTGTFSLVNDTPKYNVSTGITAGSGIFTPMNITFSQYTIAFWAKHTASSKMLMGSCPSADSTQTSWYWYGDNSFKYPSGEYYYTYNGGAKDSFKWTHFVATYDGTNVRVYRNGVSEGSKACTGDQVMAYLSVGYGYGSRYIEDSSMSDFRIYTTALSADDVKSLYNNSAYIDNQGNIYGAIYEEV